MHVYAHVHVHDGDGTTPTRTYAQPVNLKLAIRVAQLKLPVAGRYSLVYQKVQSSTGSICIAL